MKQRLIDLLTDFKEAVEQDNVEVMITMFDAFGIDSRRTTILDVHLRRLLIDDIKTAVQKRKRGVIKVKRKGVYGDTTFDFYKIVGDNLHRNGTDAKWTSICKLYTAYKQIHKIE